MSNFGYNAFLEKNLVFQTPATLSFRGELPCGHFESVISNQCTLYEGVSGFGVIYTGAHGIGYCDLSKHPTGSSA